MWGEPAADIASLVQARKRDPGALLDILIDIQKRFRAVSQESIDLVAHELSIPRVIVEDTASFYSFFSESPKGKIAIGIGNDIIDEFHGSPDIAQAFTRELGIGYGQTTPDGLFSLEPIAYIGVPDQAPAIMLNETIVTQVKPQLVPSLVRRLEADPDPQKLALESGDGNNAHVLVRSMVRNNIRRRGPSLLAEVERGAALRKALSMNADEVIMEVKIARIRGRGGAGFPAGMKWDLARHNGVDGERWVICNADEGEPGTFKDRVLLTERPDLIFDGMTVAAFGIKARHGILYLRAEYAYLREFLEKILADRREDNLLGENIGGVQGFSFDIRLQTGAGAYVCGEETSLISSCEGVRGDPMNRPPFPVNQGYHGQPTIVNNVETFCCVARTIENGAAWFISLGSRNCPGTKLLSISGDCAAPGIYEVPFGIRLEDLLEMAGATSTQAVAVGGPSGVIVGSDSFSMPVDYEGLSTGGSIMVFNRSRDLFRVVEKFADFFMDESCGHCTPCRVGTFLLRSRLQTIRDGHGCKADLDYLENLAQVLATASRCGLGNAAPNPIVSTLKNFRSIYEDRLVTPPPGRKASFDIYESIALAEKIAGRKSVVFPH